MPRTVEELLAEARDRLVRLAPVQAAAAQAAGAVLVDIRGDDQIRTHGSIPGAIRIPRNVLEWRADPTPPPATHVSPISMPSSWSFAKRAISRALPPATCTNSASRTRPTSKAASRRGAPKAFP